MNLNKRRRFHFIEKEGPNLVVGPKTTAFGPFMTYKKLLRTSLRDNRVKGLVSTNLYFCVKKPHTRFNVGVFEPSKEWYLTLKVLHYQTFPNKSLSTIPH